MNKIYDLETVKKWRSLGAGGTHNTLVVYMPEGEPQQGLNPGQLYLWDGEIYGIRGASVITDPRGHKLWGIPTKNFRILPNEEISVLKEQFK
jgi:hypothetical protein